MNGSSTCVFPQPQGLFDHYSATQKSVMLAVNNAYLNQSSLRIFSPAPSERCNSRGGRPYPNK